MTRDIDNNMCVLLELAGWRGLLQENSEGEVTTVSPREGLVTRQNAKSQHPGQQELRDPLGEASGEGPAPVLLPRARAQGVSLQRRRHQRQGHGEQVGCRVVTLPCRGLCINFRR